MNKRLYVGNIHYDTSESELRAAFAPHGDVEAVHIVTDRDTGRARGFAFVEMASSAQADAAQRALHGTDLGGRTIVVNEAKDKPRPAGPRPDRDGGRRRDRGYDDDRGPRHRR